MSTLGRVTNSFAKCTIIFVYFINKQKLAIPTHLPPHLQYIIEVRSIYLKVFLWRVVQRYAVEACDFSVIASWLLLDLLVVAGVFLRVWCVLLGHLSIGLFLVDCFCDIITCHYCFFCLYYFNVLHVFCAMRNSPNCDIFYCIIILKAICLIL